jgi:threonine synthase
MNYQSTRGHDVPQSFSEILLGGLAPDGGLYLPKQYPQITAEELEAWRKLPYADLAFEMLSRFCDDIPAEDLRALTRKTYTADVYCNARAGDNTADITPLRTLGEEGGTKLQLLGLSNGPTLAFKDMAMQLLGNLFEYALKRAGEAQHPGRHLGRHRQRGRIRDARQGRHPRVHAEPAPQDERVPDRADVQPAGPEHLQHRDRRRVRRRQDIVKAVSNDHAFKARQRIGTVNSINWAAWWPRWCTTSRAGCWRPAVRDRRCRSACRRATSATSAPATSRA